MNLSSVLSLGVTDATDGTDLAGELVVVATDNVNFDSCDFSPPLQPRQSPLARTCP